MKHAAFGFFIGITAFLNFLAKPNAKQIALAGVAFGIAELLKFSLILLIPIYGILLVVWAASKIQYPWKARAGMDISERAGLALVHLLV